MKLIHFVYCVPFLIFLSASAQEINPNIVAEEDYNKQGKPIVVSSEATHIYRKAEQPWEYIEYEGILIGYARSQNIDKIKNLLELNIFILLQYKKNEDKENTTAVYLTDDLSFTDYLLYAENVCNVKIFHPPEIKKNGFLKLDDGDEWRACKLFAAAISVNELEIIKIKDGEFSLRDVSKD